MRVGFETIETVTQNYEVGFEIIGTVTQNYENCCYSDYSSVQEASLSRTHLLLPVVQVVGDEPPAYADQRLPRHNLLPYQRGLLAQALNEYVCVCVKYMCVYVRGCVVCVCVRARVCVCVICWSRDASSKC